MLRRFVNTARVCGVGIALSSLLGGAVHAADFSTKAAPVPYAEDDFWTRPYLFGDLGRTQLKERGIDLGLTLGNESVGNVTGGSRNTAANAGQLWFGAKFDMGKLAGIQGGTVGLTLVDRFGKNLNTEADIPALQLTNEVFGRRDAPIIVSWIFAGHQIGGALAAFGAGAGRTIEGDYLLAFLASGLACLLASVMVLRIAKPQPALAPAE